MLFVLNFFGFFLNLDDMVLRIFLIMLVSVEMFLVVGLFLRLVKVLIRLIVVERFEIMLNVVEDLFLGVSLLIILFILRFVMRVC